jgi:hypothetical protein
MSKDKIKQFKTIEEYFTAYGLFFLFTKGYGRQRNEDWYILDDIFCQGGYTEEQETEMRRMIANNDTKRLRQMIGEFIMSSYKPQLGFLQNK